MSSALAPEPAGAPGERRVLWLSVAAALCWLLSREWHFSRWMDDDAFISFRYARNLVRGHGLVFNPGEYVEGYSNFLWTLILAAAHALGADLPGAALALGVLASVVTVLVLAWYGRTLLPEGSPPLFGVLAAVLLAVLEPWSIWAVGGLENTFAALTILLTFLCYFEYLESRRPALLTATGALAAGAALLHPSYALAGIVIGVHVALRVMRGREASSSLFRLALPVVAVAVPYLAWKLWYYGHLLPNTFAAKSGLTLPVLRRGLRYYGLAVRALPLFAAALVALPFVHAARRDARPWLLAATALAYAAYGILVGGEEFFAFRILVAVLPLLCLLVQYEAALACAKRAYALPLFVLLVAAAAVPAALSPRVRGLDAELARDFTNLLRTAARELKRHFPPDTLFAHSGAGVMAYETDFPFLDTLGLTDEHIAHRVVDDLGQGGAGHERGDGRYVLERRPGLVMFSGYPLASHVPLELRGDNELYALPGFRSAYSPVMITFRFTPRGGTEQVVPLPVFVRNDVVFH